MRAKRLRKSFFLPNKETFKNLSDYVRLAIPSTLMLIFDWWSFEILAVMAGSISVEVTGAHIIILNVYYLFCMFCLGAHIAACVHVGRSMGQKMTGKAKTYLKLTSLYAFVMNLCIASFIYFGSHYVGMFFTD